MRIVFMCLYVWCILLIWSDLRINCIRISLYSILILNYKSAASFIDITGINWSRMKEKNRERARKKLEMWLIRRMYAGMIVALNCHSMRLLLLQKTATTWISINTRISEMPLIMASSLSIRRLQFPIWFTIGKNDRQYNNFLLALYACLIYLWLKYIFRNSIVNMPIDVWVCTALYIKAYAPTKSRVLFSCFSCRWKTHVPIGLQCERCDPSWKKPKGKGKGSTVCLCCCLFV